MNIKINSFIQLIEENARIGQKETLAKIVQEHFNLEKKGAVLYCKDFAVRFCSTKKKSLSVANTVMALKHIRTFDNIPLFVCVVAPDRNVLCLANATFIKKVSHSSINLTEDNIVGNINYSDIIKEYHGIANMAANYEELFEMHSQIGFLGNLSRIVLATKNIVPTGIRFMPTIEQRDTILDAPRRAYEFMNSDAYLDLKADLDNRAASVKEELQVIDEKYPSNVNIRGRLIEYFIASNDDKQKDKLMKKISNNELIDDLLTGDGLGDYSTKNRNYIIETDIKSKDMKYNSAPKGYNVDKLLSFLSKPESIYLLYIVIMNGKNSLKTDLVSIFQKQILDKTRIQHHWAGRNSRGVAQFDGQALEYFLKDDKIKIEIEKAKRYLIDLLDEDDY